MSAREKSRAREKKVAPKERKCSPKKKGYIPNTMLYARVYGTNWAPYMRPLSLPRSRF